MSDPTTFNIDNLHGCPNFNAYCDEQGIRGMERWNLAEKSMGIPGLPRHPATFLVVNGVHSIYKLFVHS